MVAGAFLQTLAPSFEVMLVGRFVSNPDGSQECETDYLQNHCWCWERHEYCHGPCVGRGDEQDALSWSVRHDAYGCQYRRPGYLVLDDM